MNTSESAESTNSTRNPVARLVNHFIHPALRNDPDTFNRAQILVASMLTLAVGALIALSMILLSGFPMRSNILASLLILPASGWFMYSPRHLRLHGDYDLASHAAITVILAIIVGGILLSGGPAVSPVVQLLVIPPLTAYFFGGQPLGKKIVMITLSIATTFILAESIGIEFIQTVHDPDKMNILNFVVTFLNLTVISMMAFIYEYTAAVLKHERDAEREKFMHLAKTDPLTGLANRRNFDARLHERMVQYGNDDPQRRFALGYLDLDGFKPINDRYGHAIGDEVLRVISDRLRSILRGTDFVGRHGGDEFMLMLDMPGEQKNLEIMAERLLATIAQPIPTSAGEVGVTGSLGFALFPLDADEIEALKRSADSAMYEAKRDKGTWKLFRQTAVPAS